MVPACRKEVMLGGGQKGGGGPAGRLLLGIFLFSLAGAGYGQVVHSVRPSQTDPAITQFDNAHFAYVDPTVPARNKLLVFFPGTGATPVAYTEMLKAAATMGFHAIGLMYVNGQSVNLDICSQTTDPSCHKSVRLEIIDGTDRSNRVEVDRTNSIENRLIQLLQHLQAQFPLEGWGQYLTGDGSIRWGALLVSGHSQGAGHAGLLAKTRVLHRCLMFAGHDWYIWGNRPADWISEPSATPASAYYGFTHLRDDLVDESNLLESWSAFGMDAFGERVVVEHTSGPPYGATRMLATDLEPRGQSNTDTNQPNYHGATVVDSATPLDGSEQPRYIPVWNYLFGALFRGFAGADIVVFHPAGGDWYIRDHDTGDLFFQEWGWSESTPVPGDYDGDGLLDIAVYHRAQGDWYLLESTVATLRLQNWGWSETFPIPGDYDGDGRDDLAVYHPPAGNWYIRRSSDSALWLQNWGWSETVPVPADYDGDGTTDLAVYHPAQGDWYVRLSTTEGFLLQNWGWHEVAPVPADYDGDGRVDLAVFPRAAGNWYIWPSSTGRLRLQNWGWHATTAVPADYDEDGQADLAVFHRPNGDWYIQPSTTGALRLQNWGWSETIPTDVQNHLNRVMGLNP